MSAESAFLISLGQTLATMALYDARHPARERVLDTSFEQLLALTRDRVCVEYSFLAGETVAGNRPLPELAAWDWSTRLGAAGVQRLEIDAGVSRQDYQAFVEELFERVNGRVAEDTAVKRQLIRSPIRFGLLTVQRGAGSRGTPGGRGDGGVRSGRDSGRFGGLLTLADEIGAVEWIHGEIRSGVAVPMVEVEAVVRSLAGAMRADARMFLPLLTLKEFDQYTTTHACNVAVLAMGLAERLGLAPDEVRAFGVAGLLHDIGKVKIPHELLVKPGRYTDDERRIVQRHPVDGARLILERERGLGLAAVVAYEHHIFLNGEGYPALAYPRACHYASRIVHVCDIYDALCTDRPYRAAWEPEQALGYLMEQAGRELDPEVVQAFRGMVDEARIDRVPLDVARGGATAEATAGQSDGAAALVQPGG